MEALLFKATTLPDAWFQLVFALMKGEVPRNVYTIDKGSYVGQQRLEFPYVTVQIDNPGEHPRIPFMPEGSNLPPPVEDEDYVDAYFTSYLMDTRLMANETYIYGTWLAPGVQRVIEQLKDSPGNNQAAISLGGWAPAFPPFEQVSKNIHAAREAGINHGIFLGDEEHAPLSKPFVDTDNYIDPGTGERDPACLRMVDFRLDQNNKLHMVLYFRSWDLWGGFPANLAGLQLVKEYVAQAIGAEDGKIIASSKGLHIYDYCIEIAAQRLGMPSVGTMDDLLAYIAKQM